MKPAILLAALALSACTTTKYVPVKCVTPEQVAELKRQEPERVGDKLTGQAQRDFQIVAGNAARLRAWGRGLLGVVESCGG